MRLARMVLKAMVCVSLVGVGCASTITSKSRKKATIYYDISVNTLQNGDLRGALRELLKVIEWDPEMYQAHNALGLVYHGLGVVEKADTHYRRALELKPDFSDALNNRGTLLVDMGRYGEAIESFKRAMGDIMYATPSLAEGNLGWAYYKIGQSAQARQHLDNAVIVNPRFCRGYEWLIRIALEQETPLDVSSNYEKFQRYCVSDRAIGDSIDKRYLARMDYYFALGLIKQGLLEQAREVLRRCGSSDSQGNFEEKCVSALKAL